MEVDGRKRHRWTLESCEEGTSLHCVSMCTRMHLLGFVRAVWQMRSRVHFSSGSSNIDIE